LIPIRRVTHTHSALTYEYDLLFDLQLIKRSWVDVKVEIQPVPMKQAEWFLYYDNEYVDFGLIPEDEENPIDHAMTWALKHAKARCHGDGFKYVKRDFEHIAARLEYEMAERKKGVLF